VVWIGLSADRIVAPGCGSAFGLKRVTTTVADTQLIKMRQLQCRRPSRRHWDHVPTRPETLSSPAMATTHFMPISLILVIAFS